MARFSGSLAYVFAARRTVGQLCNVKDPIKYEPGIVNDWLSVVSA
jgi:hypothetical protein